MIGVPEESRLGKDMGVGCILAVRDFSLGCVRASGQGSWKTRDRASELEPLGWAAAERSLPKLATWRSGEMHAGGDKCVGYALSTP